ncbi:MULTISPECIES: hypothetical protein [Pimelobacter]|uniref:hypothetical protein n=1 Tax=Pimelobacter TaxID=2044 RepID=UPI001C040CEF|nr:MULTISPECIES: hypothetical protein [Pimelobacter]MBU2698866.1 hypothetical protein [Pimelobacter sp. 30-1]UUW92998.1 hypothetical protein M0M43_30660 [Pimelobacter simplex]UUW99031.1 hypothetical protein M0M48_30680 [Pimelobacter simplex]
MTADKYPGLSEPDRQRVMQLDRTISTRLTLVAGLAIVAIVSDQTSVRIIMAGAIVITLALLQPVLRQRHRLTNPDRYRSKNGGSR